MSTASPPRPDYRSGAPLERMPFGKYKGRPFAEVPPQYAGWLLNREIDDRLRSALKSVAPSGQVNESGGQDQKVTPIRRSAEPTDVVSVYLGAREAAAAAKRRLLAARGALVRFLDARGGTHVDEASRQSLSIEDRPRWDYDAAALHRLVDEGAISEERFFRACAQRWTR